LAGLRVAVVVLILRLQRAQYVERATGEVWIDEQVLQRNDQAVAAERGHEPRQAGSRQEDHVIRAGDWQPERSHVLKRLAIETIDRPKLLLRLRPLRGDPTAAHDAAGLHLEDVCEVATQRDLELKAYPLHAVVGDVEILVHAAVDRSADDKA